MGSLRPVAQIRHGRRYIEWHAASLLPHLFQRCLLLMPFDGAPACFGTGALTPEMTAKTKTLANRSPETAHDLGNAMFIGMPCQHLCSKAMRGLIFDLMYIQ